MIGDEYARARRRAAFVTALDHPDAATRQRAETRVRRWTDVLAGMASGALRIGSRTPIAGAPVWATPEVVRGGFVTGELAAGGPLSEDERATAEAHGLPEDRAALFRHALTPAGLAELDRRLTDGCYRADHAEETALLTVVWLHRIGEHLAADRLVAKLRPLAARVRFTPRPASAPETGDLVSRTTVSATRAALRARPAHPRVDRMRETLTVWHPLRDDLLAHWRATVRDGWVGAHRPPEWVAASRVLLDRYDALAAVHGRDRVDPDDNLAVMLRALRAVLLGDEGELSLLATRMARMADRPPERQEQARIAALPTHPQLARAVADRLDDLDGGVGIDDPEAVLGPVTSFEVGRTGADDEPVPAAIARIVRRARRASVEDLVADGTIPSAEVLAELTPFLTAAAVAADAPDAASRRLLETGLRAFDGRRSLLLTGLASQVRAEELPWIAAVQEHRDASAESPSRARLAATGELVLRAFPGTPVPNPLVEQLRTLTRAAGEEHPLVPVLAADIFHGRFSRTFARAASLAGDLLAGTLYARYYDLGPHAWPDDGRTFSAACAARAEAVPGTVAGNGAIIEQAQVLTTHNLAVLAGPVGVRLDWADAARRSLDDVVEHLRSAFDATGRRGALRALAGAAAAWRQMVFHLSAAGPDVTAAFLADHRDLPLTVGDAVHHLLTGLHAAHDGQEPAGTRAPRTVDELGTHPFLGWVAEGEHPILACV